MDRISWDSVFSRFLSILSERSTCLKYKTAAVIVKGTQILSMGYNGTFSHCVECIDYWKDQYKLIHEEYKEIFSFDAWIKTNDWRKKHREWSACNEVHAEINALNWISKHDITPDHILYTIYSPCDACAKAIIAYGIKQVKYQYEYPNGRDALELLKKNNITVTML
jgi:dCMP deaminase